MATERDYYAVLQLNRAASDDDIDAAYERLSRLYDPAVSKKPRAQARWQQISEAYETLSDPQRRAAYDRKLNRQFAGPEINLPSFVTSPYTLAGAAVAVILGFMVVLIAISLFDEGPGAVTQATGTPPSSPGVTPEGQTPRPSPAPAPPAVSGEPVTTASGLQYIDLQPGAGATPQTGQTIVAEYTGWLQADGTLFDSSFNPDRSPFEFQIATGNVIQGWHEGFATMQVGGKRRLIVPPALAYGQDGRGSIPPNATLIFDVELLEVR